MLLKSSSKILLKERVDTSNNTKDTLLSEAFLVAKKDLGLNSIRLFIQAIHHAINAIYWKFRIKLFFYGLS